MGLDMYLYRCKPELIPAGARVDFSEPSGLGVAEIGYWRKAWAIHRWFQKLYDAKGGQKLDFNCVPVVFDAADLAAFLRDYRQMPKLWKETPRIMRSARDAIEYGDAVFYSAWF